MSICCFCSRYHGGDGSSSQSISLEGWRQVVWDSKYSILLSSGLFLNPSQLQVHVGHILADGVSSDAVVLICNMMVLTLRMSCMQAMVQSAVLKDYITAHPYCLDLAVPLWITASNHGKRIKSEEGVTPPSPVWVVVPSLSIRTSITLSDHPVWLPSSIDSIITGEGVSVSGGQQHQHHRHYNNSNRSPSDHRHYSSSSSSNKATSNDTLPPFKADNNDNETRALSTTTTHASSSSSPSPSVDREPHHSHRYLISPKSKLSPQRTSTCLTDLTTLLNIPHYPTSSYKATRASTHIFW